MGWNIYFVEWKGSVSVIRKKYPNTYPFKTKQYLIKPSWFTSLPQKDWCVLKISGNYVVFWLREFYLRFNCPYRSWKCSFDAYCKNLIFYWQANITRTNHIMWTMGTDFRYQYAHTWYRNMDKLIHYVNKVSISSFFHFSGDIFSMLYPVCFYPLWMSYY